MAPRCALWPSRQARANGAESSSLAVPGGGRVHPFFCPGVFSVPSAEGEPMSESADPLVIHKSSPVPWLLLVLVLGVAGAGGYVLFQRGQAADAELASANARAKDLQHKLEGDEAQNGKLTE